MHVYLDESEHCALFAVLYRMESVKPTRMTCVFFFFFLVNSLNQRKRKRTRKARIKKIKKKKKNRLGADKRRETVGRRNAQTHYRSRSASSFRAVKIKTVHEKRIY